MKHIKYGMERCNLKEGEVVMLHVSCDDWLDIPTPHKMIQLEEAVE